MKAVILASGFGTRLKPLTDTLPKVMIEIGEKPILEHLINLCKEHQILDIVITLGYLPDVIREYFGDGSAFGVRIKYTFEREMLGGAGVLRLAQHYLGDSPFFVLNGDVLTDVNLSEIIKFHDLKKGMGVYLVHKTDHPYDSDIVVLDKNDRVIKFFRPAREEDFIPLSKSGTHLFDPKIIDYIPRNQFFSLEKDLTPILLEENRGIFGYISDCYSKDMGTPERLKKVREDYISGMVKI